MIGSDLGIWLELGNFLSPLILQIIRPVTWELWLRLLTTYQYPSSPSLVRTPLLAEHIATLNEDSLSQLPLPPAVAMWSNSGQWHTRRAFYGTSHTTPEKEVISFAFPFIHLLWAGTSGTPLDWRWPYSKIMELTEGPVPLVTVEPPQSWASCFRFFPERKHVGAFKPLLSSFYY